VPSVLAAYWKAAAAAAAMLAQGDRKVSSIVLSAPSFDDRWRAWHEDVFPALEASVLAAGLGRELGIVCFHPNYDTPPDDFLRRHRFGHMYGPSTLRRSAPAPQRLQAKLLAQKRKERWLCVRVPRDQVKCR
jgi:hypothetical protein